MNIQPPTIPNLQIQDRLKNTGEALTNTINSAKDNFNDSVSGFSQQAQAGATASKGFLQSNTIVAKFAFIVLVVIGFLFLMNLGISLISYFTKPSVNPFIVKGRVDANSGKIVSTDPTLAGSVAIQRSNNKSTGLEFTWSFWLYVADLGDGTKHQHVFNKGDRSYTGVGGDGKPGIASTNNSPGVYLISGNAQIAPAISGNVNTNLSGKVCALEIIMNTNDETDINNTIIIPNIPLRKWVHVAIRMQNTIMDIYVNGIVTSRKIFTQVPKQNYYDINLFQNGGYSGSLSNLRYYGQALNAFQINSILYSGPNLNASSLDTSQLGNYTYLSNSWYSSNLSS
jgi:hypothetical protein